MAAKQTDLKTGPQGQWATPVERLSVPDLPKVAINLTFRAGALWAR